MRYKYLMFFALLFFIGCAATNVVNDSQTVLYDSKVELGNACFWSKAVILNPNGDTTPYPLSVSIFTIPEVTPYKGFSFWAFVKVFDTTSDYRLLGRPEWSFLMQLASFGVGNNVLTLQSSIKHFEGYGKTLNDNFTIRFAYDIGIEDDGYVFVDNIKLHCSHVNNDFDDPIILSKPMDDGYLGEREPDLYLMCADWQRQLDKWEKERQKK